MKSCYLKSIQLTTYLVVALFFACNPLDKTAKGAKDIKYTLMPNPLQVNDDSVHIEITGSIPTKYFSKDLQATASGRLLSASGQEFPIATITLLGESMDGEGIKISAQDGGNFKLTTVLPFQNGMENVAVEVSMTATLKGKSKEIIKNKKIGKGVVTTPQLVQSSDRPMLAANQFSKDGYQQDVKAELNFDVSSAKLKSSELQAADIKEIYKILSHVNTQNLTVKSVQINGFASPEGENPGKNDELANDRAKVFEQEIKNILAKNKINATSISFAAQGQGSDWNGFKSKMQASSVKDKDMVLRVLETINDEKERERKAREFAHLFPEIKNKVLPPLRRAEITLSIVAPAKKDEELLTLAKKDLEKLNIEELLYIAESLLSEVSEKLNLYHEAIALFPEDFRAYNNAAYYLILQGKYDEAKSLLDKAFELNANASAVNNNLGVVARLKGDTQKAMDYYSKSQGVEVNSNKAIIYILQGKYDEAASLTVVNTFNDALVKLLTGKADDAVASIDAAEEKNTALGNYLKAIAYARLGNNTKVIEFLKVALEKDASLKVKLKDDVEFDALWAQEDF